MLCSLFVTNGVDLKRFFYGLPDIMSVTCIWVQLKIYCSVIELVLDFKSYEGLISKDCNVHYKSEVGSTKKQFNLNVIETNLVKWIL